MRTFRSKSSIKAFFDKNTSEKYMILNNGEKGAHTVILFVTILGSYTGNCIVTMRSESNRPIIRHNTQISFNALFLARGWEARNAVFFDTKEEMTNYAITTYPFLFFN